MAVEFIIRCDKCGLTIEHAYGRDPAAAKLRAREANLYRYENGWDHCMACYEVLQRRREQERQDKLEAVKDRLARPWSTKTYQQARTEHAFLLRCEGLTCAEIATRLGMFSRGQASALATAGALRLGRAMVAVTLRIEEAHA